MPSEAKSTEKKVYWKWAPQWHFPGNISKFMNKYKSENSYPVGEGPNKRTSVKFPLFITSVKLVPIDEF